VSSYRVALTASAEKELRGLPTKVIARMMPRLEHLASAPRASRLQKNSRAAIRNGGFVLAITG